MYLSNTVLIVSYYSACSEAFRDDLDSKTTVFLVVVAVSPADMAWENMLTQMKKSCVRYPCDILLIFCPCIRPSRQRLSYFVALHSLCIFLMLIYDQTNMRALECYAYNSHTKYMCAGYMVS